MSDNVTLSHDAYIGANNINVKDLPEETQAKIINLDNQIEAYSKAPTDKVFQEIEAESNTIHAEIEAWFTAKQAEAQAIADAEA